MNEEKFVEQLQAGFSLGTKAKGQRDSVYAELVSLGAAYVRVLNEKFGLDMEPVVEELPPLTGLVQAGFTDTNVIVLFLKTKTREQYRITIVSCSFEHRGAFPCVITAGEMTSVCKTLKQVQSALVSVCRDRGVHVAQEAERIKAYLSKPSSNASENNVPSSNEDNMACPSGLA